MRRHHGGVHAVFLLPFPEAAAVVGWVAAALVLVGYELMVSGRLAADSARYLTINAAGSAGLAVSTVASHAWQSAMVNVLWLAFGMAPLHRALQRRRARLRAAAQAQPRA